MHPFFVKVMIKKEPLFINDYFVYQDSSLYTFTSDSILLSRFAKAKKGDIVADFCSGSGIVGLNFFALNEGLIKQLHLFEMQQPLYELSASTIRDNGLENKVEAHNVKVQEIANKYNNYFSLIMVNPPYMPATQKNVIESENQNFSKEACKTEITLSLSELTKVASKKLKHGGRLCMVNRADRLAEIMYEYKVNKIEPKKMQFIYSGTNSTPYLVMVEGVKGGKLGLTVLENIKN